MRLVIGELVFRQIYFQSITSRSHSPSYLALGAVLYKYENKFTGHMIAYRLSSDSKRDKFYLPQLPKTVFENNI